MSSIAFVAIRATAVSASAVAAVIVLDADRGLSSGLLFLLDAVVVMDFVPRRMRFGRMVFAVGGPVLLNAIAAAVIGGVSLFGGRGSMWAALLGTMVSSRSRTAWTCCR